MATAAIGEDISVESEGAGVSRLVFWLTTIFVMALGAAEGWCGRTDSGDVYGSDAVQYLDIARAMARGDWHSALNPLWSQGYPALLALVRPLFKAGIDGDWASTRWLNLAIFLFSWLAFAWLIRELARTLGRIISLQFWIAAVCVFVTAQVCVDQVSRAGPDQLVAAIFFLVCALMLKMMERPRVSVAAALGVALGIGFLVKAIFLPLGCCVLVILAAALWRGRRLRELTVSAGIFATIAVAYAIPLSRAAGKPTFGESGALNYAWHVDRLAKWVHWEGGVDPAAKAWPKPWIARFAHWETDPPDFGAPVHPSERVGADPMVYVFHAPIQATYVPYFDPAYWYEGYHKVFRWRYQVIALAKNAGDLAVVLVRQPLVWAWLLVMAISLWRREGRRRAWQQVLRVWPVVAIALLGVAIYLPVHLEGRYLSGFLALIAVVRLAAVDWSGSRGRLMVALLLVGFAVGLVKDQREIWVRVGHGWTPRANVEWRAAAGVETLGLPPGTEVGVIGWTANLHCDWAYMSGVRITSEIASPADENAFWQGPEARRTQVLAEFQHAGARVVFSWDHPPDGVAGWEQLAGAPIWVHRL